jgi:hypothetical protein
MTPLPIEYDTVASDLLNGTREISVFLGKSERQVEHLLQAGHLPMAFKLGDKWHLRRSTFLRHLQERERGNATPDPYQVMCSLRQQWFAAWARRIKTQPSSEAVALECDGTLSTLRQLAALGGGR